MAQRTDTQTITTTDIDAKGPGQKAAGAITRSLGFLRKEATKVADWGEHGRKAAEELKDAIESLEAAAEELMQVPTNYKPGSSPKFVEGDLVCPLERYEKKFALTLIGSQTNTFRVLATAGNRALIEVQDTKRTTEILQTYLRHAPKDAAEKVEEPAPEPASEPAADTRPPKKGAGKKGAK